MLASTRVLVSTPIWKGTATFPHARVGNCVQGVGAGGERLAFDGDIIGERDGGVFVGPGAPDLAVGNDFTEDFAADDEGGVIGDGDVGEADALRDVAVLADARKN